MDIQVKNLDHLGIVAGIAGRPTKNQSPEHFTYRLTAQVIPLEGKNFLTFFNTIALFFDHKNI